MTRKIVIEPKKGGRIMVTSLSAMNDVKAARLCAAVEKAVAREVRTR
jgi:hypothetical protein